MFKKNYWKLIASLIITNGIGFLGSFFTSPKINNWYADLIKPDFNPPNWVFGPVWTFLFILMAIALYLIWTTKTKASYKKIAITLFSVQLFFNFLWSVIFFGLQCPGLAFVEIIILWILILATIISFVRINKLAAWLMVPYILWVSFASVLNFVIWLLNTFNNV